MVKELTAKRGQSKRKPSCTKRKLEEQKTSVYETSFENQNMQMTFNQFLFSRHFASVGCEKAAWTVHASREY